MRDEILSIAEMGRMIVGYTNPNPDEDVLRAMRFCGAHTGEHVEFVAAPEDRVRMNSHLLILDRVDDLESSVLEPMRRGVVPVVLAELELPKMLESQYGAGVFRNGIPFIELLRHRLLRDLLVYVCNPDLVAFKGQGAREWSLSLLSLGR